MLGRTPFAPSILFLFLLLIACRTSLPSDALSQKNSAANLPEGIPNSSLAKPEQMDRNYFRMSYSHLSEEEFEAKWQASLASPLLFFRSYVNTWYVEVNNIPDPGKVGPCFGDAHPENFGFIWYGSEDFRYLYNDLDDSGACPVAFDALRYFTALKLFWGKDDLEKKVREDYVKALSQDEKLDSDSIKEYRPKLNKLLEKIAEKNLDGRKIKRSETVIDLSETKSSTLIQGVSSYLKLEPKFKDSVLDLAEVIVKSGGSGGLHRYYLLFENVDKELQLLEIKELTKPATGLGDWADEHFLPRNILLYLAWEEEAPKYFALARMEGSDYIIRSRVKSSVDLIDLSDEEKLKLFKYQARLLAKLHKLSLNKIKGFEVWLDKESEFMASRYKAAYKIATKPKKSNNKKPEHP